MGNLDVGGAMPPALAGWRVLEATEGIAGGYAGKLLADQGAEVVKLEPPQGDPLRRWSAAAPDEPTPDTGALFAFLNAGKRSVAGGGDDVVAGLLGWAQVVLTGDGTEAVVRPAAWRHRREATTVVTISGLGLDGPVGGEPADEFTLQAWCGSMAWCGARDTPPLQMGMGQGQWATGAVAALAALAGQAHAERSGRGGDIEVSALEVMAVCTTNYPTLYRQLTLPAVQMARGGDWPSTVRCRDGWIGLCIFTAQQWSDFAAMIGRTDLAEDERLSSMGGRSRNRPFAESVIRPWLEQHTVAEIHELGSSFRVPVALVGNGRDVVDMVHFGERGVFVTNPAGFVQPRSPFRMGASPVRPVAAAPRLGADNGFAARSGADVGCGATAPAESVTTRAVASGATRGQGRPLDGVSVIDFTAFWAGPAATHLLATLGADVVKIESPRRPDGMRFATTKPLTDPHWVEFSPTFHGSNPGKRSAAVDFSIPTGRELVMRLIEQADVVVENFTPRVMANAGLGYDQLAARRPGLIMLRMPAFGLDGPWRDHSGFAQTTEQVSGIAWLNGTEEGEPLARTTVDPIAGTHGAFAVLAALDHRRRTGQGQMIELPMVEVALNYGAEPILTWSAYQTLLGRQTNRGPHGAPQGVYACAGADRWIAVSVRSDDQWRAVVRSMGDPVWGSDPTLSTRPGRRSRHDDVDRRLADWFAERDRDEEVSRLLGAGVAAAPVWDHNVQDQLPQLAARGFTQWLDHPLAGMVGLPGTGMRSDQFDLTYLAAAPTVGQHTAEVMREWLGLSDTELADLAATGITAPIDHAAHL